jgi:hypothetical protein
MLKIGFWIILPKNHFTEKKLPKGHLTESTFNEKRRLAEKKFFIKKSFDQKYLENGHLTENLT